MLVAAGSLACPAPDDNPAADPAADPDPDGLARSRIGVVFDPLAVAPGDSVAGLAVVATEIRLAMDSTPVGSVAFRGEVDITGRRIRHFDADAASQSVCFEADSASAERLPRWQGDRRRPWFCFDHPAPARSALGDDGDSAAARIVIDEFTIHRGFSDEVNGARFVRRLDR